MRKLTAKQEDAMRRLNEGEGVAFVYPDVAKQLKARGLVEITGNKYQQHAWQRAVPGTTVWEVRIIRGDR